jgi:hypothetical protein
MSAVFCSRRLGLMANVTRPRFAIHT